MGFNLCDLVLSPFTLTFFMELTSVIGNFIKFHDDETMGT